MDLRYFSFVSNISPLSTNYMKLFNLELIHIQKEEQKHGESIFQYMESKGMYNVQ